MPNPNTASIVQTIFIPRKLGKKKKWPRPARQTTSILTTSVAPQKLPIFAPANHANKALTMISRRNIRVKVMQTLYTLEAQELPPKPGEAARILQKHFDQSRQLLTYLIYCITEIARYAETDSRVRASKHLPSDSDLHVNIKLAGNEQIWKILEDPSWKSAVITDKPQLQDNKELIRRLYQDLAATEEYNTYTSAQGRERKTEKEIIEYIFSTILLPSETFLAHVEELFTNRDDDAEMICQIVMSYIGKPGSVNFQEIISTDKKEFAVSLLETVLEK